MHPKDLFMHSQKMVIIYYPMAYCFGDITTWSRRIFDILIASISWIFARILITNINHEFVLSTFSTLTVCNILAFENSQNLFSCGPPFGPFCSAKYLNIEQKLLIRTVYHTFLESKHPEVTKNPYYVLFLEGSKKRCQLMDYIW